MLTKKEKILINNIKEKNNFILEIRKFMGDDNFYNMKQIIEGEKN